MADDKLVYTYVPAMIQYYLGAEPILPNVTTYRLGEPDELHYVLGRLDQLVIKPVDGSGGHGIVIGPQADDVQLETLRQALLAERRRWIAQELVRLSTSPTYVEDRLQPRHIDLRPFAINDGERVWVVPGGLTRVALPQGSFVVNSSQGGGSKDTWVLADRRAPVDPDGVIPPRVVIPPASGVAVASAGPAPGPGIAQSNQQQQEVDRPC